MASSSVTNSTAYIWICALIVSTSLFEVAYITYQGSQGAASHYNTSDPLHALLFGVMAVVAVGLIASQGWLAWEILKENQVSEFCVTTLGVLIELALTAVTQSVKELKGMFGKPANTVSIEDMNKVIVKRGASAR